MNEEMFRKIVGEVIDDRLGPLFVERDQHYKDHEFIKEVRTMGMKARYQAMKVVIGGLISTTALLLLWGIYRFVEAIAGRVKT